MKIVVMPQAEIIALMAAPIYAELRRAALVHGEPGLKTRNGSYVDVYGPDTEYLRKQAINEAKKLLEQARVSA